MRLRRIKKKLSLLIPCSGKDSGVVMSSHVYSTPNWDPATFASQRESERESGEIKDELTMHMYVPKWAYRKPSVAYYLEDARREGILSNAHNLRPKPLTHFS